MYTGYIKRLFDFLIAMATLLLIGWLLAVIALWLHYANKGAGAFFYQERPGRGGEIFKLMKFKSMTDETDENGKLLPDAKRLTKMGRFIRSTSIDELPQLINILKGDMSLIGPRPLYVRYMPYYSEEENRRHEVRPGITGWAQVNGRKEVEWHERIKLNNWYVDHVSFPLDVKIFFKTIFKVLSNADNENTGETVKKETETTGVGK